MTERLLDAGAILPGTSPAEPGLDTLTGRVYRHPALDGRLVVRLVTGALGPAEDLSMEYLGFAAETAAPVGYTRSRALGFPAWALVHDPANGRHALALVKEMEKLARMAKTKPGNARDGYESLAKRLGEAVPHFLPTFWEQAGRAFVASENAKMAASCFASARQAEQVHGLPIDEDRLREVHLEFAFAGALTAKGLSEYAKQIAQRRPAGEAYQLVRAIAVRRVAGGLPPAVALADDLRRLAKAAGLDPEREAEAVVADILAYPAVAKAHEGFWKAYRRPLERLSKRDPAVRLRLLAIMPDPPGWEVDFTDTWLGLLESTGAATDLVTRADVDAVGWLERLAKQRRRGYSAGRTRSPHLLDLTATMSPRLKAADRPLRILGDNLWQADLDLLDVCLAAGVPVAPAHAERPFDVTRWFTDRGPGRRDLAAVAADPRFLPPLIEGLRHLLRRDNRPQAQATFSRALHSDQILAILASAGLRHAALMWIGDLVHRTEDSTILGLEELLRHLSPLWSPAGVAMAPQAVKRLAAVDVSEALARTLRTGFLIELAWPAYEATTPNIKIVEVGDSWPELVIHDQHRGYAISPDGAVNEHVFRFPAGKVRSSHPPCTCRLIDEQFFVTLGLQSEPWGYWSNRPAEIFELRQPNSQFTPGASSLPLPLAGGGVTTGGRPWQAGDTSQPGQWSVSSDGNTFWRCEPESVSYGQTRVWRWREFDPASGVGGRYSVPAFFEKHPPADAELIPQWSWIRPAPKGFDASPLGAGDGLIGWRLFRRPDGTQIGQSVDGRTVHWRPTADTGGHFLVGAVMLPGDDRPRPVTAGGTYWPRTAVLRTTMWDVTGHQPVQRYEASHDVPPFFFWHALRPRDPAGSAALRAVTDAQVEAILAEVAGSAGDQLGSAINAAVRRQLPAIASVEIMRYFRGAVRSTIGIRDRLTELHRLLSESDRQAETAPAPVVHDGDITKALSALVSRASYYYYGTGRETRQAVVGQIQGVSAVLSGSEAGSARQIPSADLSWPQLLPGLGAVAMIAASPATPPPQRDALLGLLRVFAGSRFAGPDPRLRFVELSVAEKYNNADIVQDGQRTVVMLARGQNHFHVQQGAWLRRAIDFCPDGVFPSIDGLTVGYEIRPGGWGDSRRLTAFAEMLQAQGPIAWRPEAVHRLADLTGITRSEAALLLAGLPLGGHEANFLSTQQRQLLGIKTADARTARDALKQVSPEHRLLLLDAAMPYDPADLWKSGPDVDRLAQRWVELQGRRVPISEETLIEAGRILPADAAADVLRTFAQPTPDSWLHTDGVSTTGGWYATTSAVHGKPFADDRLIGAALGLAWLAYRLPAGDPLRQTLPAAHALILQRLRNPDLLLGHSMHARHRVPDGMPALVEGQRQQDVYAIFHLRPALVSGPDDPALDFIGGHIADAVRLLLSAGLAATMNAVAQTSVPIGQFMQNPIVSVPDLVAAVAERHHLEQDAAVYYLQVLALPDPTDRNVAAWNSWRPDRLRKAKAALMAAELVLDAKRERAGRTAFLPGGWTALRTPNLPLESWKAALFGINADGAAPMDRVLVTVPVPDLFHAAWGRVTGGDVPRYQTLTEA